MSNQLVLSAANKRHLRKASSAAVEKLVYSKLKRSALSRAWLAPSNRYRSDIITKLRRDLRPPATKFKAKHLADYTAASAPTHAIDGWSLLGRAFGALIRGDKEACIHLAYYAELRGAMSLLAAEGIGVFSSQHCVVEDNFEASILNLPRPNGTHAVIWPLLDNWAKQTRSMDLLDLTFMPAGHSMSQWLRYAGLADTSRQIARAWFSTWGLDLKQLGEDHSARNEVSYRPSEFNTCAALNAGEVSRFVTEFWTLFEPDGVTAFREIDLELLRIALENSFKAKTGKLPTADVLGFKASIDLALKTAPLEAHKVELLRQYFLREARPADSAILREALNRASPDDPRYHLQILSRAVILLRFATGASRNLLRHANMGSHELMFWVERYGPDHALWDGATPPGNPFELWTNIKDCLDSTHEFEKKSHPKGFSLQGWCEAQPRDVNLFAACELIAIWGLSA